MKQSEKDSNGVKWITVYVLHTLQQIQTECKGMKRMAVTPNCFTQDPPIGDSKTLRTDI